MTTYDLLCCGYCNQVRIGFALWQTKQSTSNVVRACNSTMWMETCKSCEDAMKKQAEALEPATKGHRGFCGGIDRREVIGENEL